MTLQILWLLSTSSFPFPVNLLKEMVYVYYLFFTSYSLTSAPTPSLKIPNLLIQWSLFFPFLCWVLRIFFWLRHCAVRGILVPWPGIEPAPTDWKHGVLTTGSPGKSQPMVTFQLTASFRLSDLWWCRYLVFIPSSLKPFLPRLVLWHGSFLTLLLLMTIFSGFQVSSSPCPLHSQSNSKSSALLKTLYKTPWTISSIPKLSTTTYISKF